MALENYTTYSEYDASGLVTVGANTLAVAGNNNTAFSVHKVFAAGISAVTLSMLLLLC